MSATAHIQIDIDGLSCAGCVGRAERAMAAIKGVITAEVNLVTKQGDITFEAPADAAAILTALKDAGYPARAADTDLAIEGLSCAGCVGRAERALKSHPAVISAAVNLATKQARVTYLTGATTPTDLGAHVGAAGYPGTPITDPTAAPTDHDAAEIATLRTQVLRAAAATLPVFVIEMGGHMIPALHHGVRDLFGAFALNMVLFLLTSYVLFWPGRVFFDKGLRALRRGAPEMNSLVALGALSAYLYSVLSTFAPGVLPPGHAFVYFEAAAVIVTLILLGRYLEARAKGQAGAAIRALLQLQPDSARVERDGNMAERPIRDLRMGDILHIRPGERVAMDSVVTEGSSWVDESMITGEPLPVEKTTGDALTGGTINGEGALRATVTATYGDSTLARIIDMVTKAQGAKLPIQHMVDKVTLWFVPAVISLAVLTLLLWLLLGPGLGLALVAAVSVLIIACPCAMGLATPASIMVATGRAAELGVLLRKSETLQTLRDAKIIAFDKTGTLTEGKPTLSEIVTLDGQDDAALRMIAAAERPSEHPIARAILAAAQARALTLPEAEAFQSHTGRGLSAQVEGARIEIGTERFMEERGVDLAPFATAPDAPRDATVFYAARDGRALARLAITDPIKPDAAQVIQALRAEGVEVAMLTGDGKTTARAIADRLGIAHVQAELLPEDKLHVAQRLRATHGTLAFVGDGINDAPVLAAADIGIAIGSGTDVAIEAADMVLISGHLQGVLNALRLSRATLRNIAQNLFWAFGYNVCLVPVAAGALYPLWGIMLSPMLGAGAMALSSVFVISNALRLKRFAPSQIQTDAAKS